MNTRRAIQASTTPNVLSISISATRNRFVAGLSDGFRIFRMDNCQTTCLPDVVGGITIAAALDDRFSAYVSTHRRQELSGPTVVVFYDSVLERELSRLDFYEPVLGLRLTSKWMAVILAERMILFQYQEIDPGPQRTQDAQPTVLRAPNLVHSLHQTSPNLLALACLSNHLLVLPAQTPGQLQLIALNADNTTTKRVLRAHNSALRCISLSQDGSLVATASEQGTLIRVFGSKSQDQVAEFRRGMDHAIIFDLAFSPGNRWIAATSDKGTLHIFDIRPTGPANTTTGAASGPKHRKTPSYTYATGGLGGRLSNLDRESSISAQSSNMGRSSPSHGSVQEYYELRPPPISAASPPVVSSFAFSLKSSPFAPRIFKDSRSAASAPFYLGNEKSHWQGGESHTWTTAPDGTRKRVKNPVPGLPNEPSGRPMKGIMTFATGVASIDEDGAVVYVIGGGGDARWEKFEMRKENASEWRLVNLGFRRFLTRQFVD